MAQAREAASDREASLSTSLEDQRAEFQVLLRQPQALCVSQHTSWLTWGPIPLGCRAQRHVCLVKGSQRLQQAGKRKVYLASLLASFAGVWAYISWAPSSAPSACFPAWFPAVMHLLGQSWNQNLPRQAVQLTPIPDPLQVRGCS